MLSVYLYSWSIEIDSLVEHLHRRSVVLSEVAEAHVEVLSSEDLAYLDWVLVSH